MKKLFLILSIGICSLITSCVEQGYYTKMYQLTEEDSGKTLEVNIDEYINITLDDLSTTGEYWILDEIYDRNFVNMIQEQSYGGRQYISFKVIGTGDTKIKFVYKHKTDTAKIKDYPKFELIIKTKEKNK